MVLQGNNDSVYRVFINKQNKNSEIDQVFRYTVFKFPVKESLLA